jgi:hypothetical protein
LKSFRESAGKIFYQIYHDIYSLSQPGDIPARHLKPNRVSNFHFNQTSILMLDKLLNLADGPLKDLLANKLGNAESTGVVKETFLEVIQKNIRSGNLDCVREMFSGRETDPDSPSVNTLKGEFSTGLSEKLGIDAQQALAIASAALPMLLNLFNKKVNDAPQANEEIQESVVKDMQSGGGTGLGGMLSSIFGTESSPGSIDLGGMIDLGKGLFKK